MCSGKNPEEIDDPEKLMQLGYECLYDERNFQKAINCYKKVLKLQPNRYAAWKGLRLAYEKSGDLEKVIECFQKTPIIKDEDLLLWLNICHNYRNDDELASALDCFEKFLAIHPNNPIAKANAEKLRKQLKKKK